MATSAREYFPVSSQGMFRRISHICLHDRTYPADVRIANHDHTNPTFCMAIEGGCKESYLGDSRVFTPLTMSFLPAAHQHELRTSFSGMRSFAAEVSSEWLESFADKTLVFDRSIFYAGGDAIQLFLRLFQEFNASDRSSVLVTEGIVLELLATVHRGRQIKERKSPEWLDRVTEAIHDVEKSPSLTQLAVDVGVHPVHLSRTFHRIHGCTPGEYSRRVRIAKACQMLNTTTLFASADIR